MTEQTEKQVRNEARSMCKAWGISDKNCQEAYMLGYVQGAFKYITLTWHDMKSEEAYRIHGNRIIKNRISARHIDARTYPVLYRGN